MVTAVQISDKDEFEKLKELGTVYERNNKTVIATTVGVAEDASSDEVDAHRINFVYTK